VSHGETAPKAGRDAYPCLFVDLDVSGLEPGPSTRAQRRALFPPSFCQVEMICSLHNASDREETSQWRKDGRWKWHGGDSQKSFQLVDPAQGLPVFTDSASSRNDVPGCMYSCEEGGAMKDSDWFVVKKSNHWRDRTGKESNIGR
jgi:hypothetical protein